MNNMDMFKTGLLSAMFVLLCGYASAQDTLLLQTGEKKTVKILEIGLEELRYTPWDQPGSPTVVIEKKNVKMVVFSNGEVITYLPDPMMVESMMNKAADKNKAIKFEFFSPLNNKLVFAFEHVVRPGFNLEHKLGIIGAGIQTDRPKASGMFFKSGAKFWSGKDYYYRGMRMSHPLRGAYVKPELTFSQFWQEQPNNNSYLFYNNKTKINYTNIGVQICFGKQILLGDIMTLDYYFGIGWGWQGSDAPETLSGYDESSWEWEPNAYSHIYMGPSAPIIISGGLTLGFLFK